MSTSKAGSIDKEQRLAEIKALIGEDNPKGLEELMNINEKNKACVEDWLSFSNFPNNQINFSAKHLFQMMYDNAKRDDDDDTIAFLEQCGAPYIFVNKIEVENSPQSAAKLKKITDLIGEEGLDQLRGFSNFNNITIVDWIGGTGENYALMELFDELLQRATDFKDDKTYQFLIDNELCNVNNPTILHNAIMRGKTLEQIKQLIALGFDVNGFVYQSTLPGRANTHIFIAYKYAPQFIPFLLEAGANPHQLNEAGYSLFALAEKDNNEEIIELLESYKDKEPPTPKAKKTAEHQTVSEVIHQILYGETLLEEEEEEEETKRKLYQGVVARWSAHGTAPNFDPDIVDHVEYFTKTLGGNIGRVRMQPQLQVDKLSEEVRFALQNMIAYAGKLKTLSNIAYADRNMSKFNKLNAKLAALSEFVNEILHQETLTPDSIEQAYNTFETKDKNTGLGVFRVYSFFYGFFQGMRYTDKNDVSRLVKSTLGQLVFMFKEAVKAQYELVDDEVSEHSDDSSHSASNH